MRWRHNLLSFTENTCKAQYKRKKTNAHSKHIFTHSLRVYENCTEKKAPDFPSLGTGLGQQNKTHITINGKCPSLYSCSYGGRKYHLKKLWLDHFWGELHTVIKH